ncbi:hypothetical protein [Streptomyces sp. B6B3]|uniref:hypothetical protein n=1 Tax=Streptomyces sp. B6B3 TaxID=3153570 RepID=UPI00325C3CB8
MSAISLILLATAGTAVGLGVAALSTARGLRADVSALRAELLGRAIPAARPVPAVEEIRSAVAEALAEERERELAEARAYWSEQDARDGEGAGPLLAAGGLDHDAAAEADEELLDALLERYLLSDSGYPAGSREGVAFVPRQPGTDGAEALETEAQEGQPLPEGRDGGPGARGARPVESAADADAEAATELAAAEIAAGRLPEIGPEDQPDEAADPGADPELDALDALDGADDDEGEAAELAAARRRHPSHPGYTLTGEPIEEHHRTAARLAQLAEARTPLADVRPGPLGTLDVFLFADGTTLCLSPSHQQAAEQLAEAVRAGEEPVLMGGSGISGAYALTFSCGQDSVFLLADRVVATSRQR